jgi:hypothetical protein
MFAIWPFDLEAIKHGSYEWIPPMLAISIKAAADLELVIYWTLMIRISVANLQSYVFLAQKAIPP